MKLQTAVSILLIVLAGCDQPRVSTPQTSPEATEQTSPTVEPLAPATLPESTTELVDQALEFSGKVVAYRVVPASSDGEIAECAWTWLDNSSVMRRPDQGN